jgi:hypothetical protein
LAERQNQDGWSWETKYTCNTSVEGVFFEVKVPKNCEVPKKFGDAGLATPQAVPNEITREDVSLSKSLLHQEEETKGSVRMDNSALTKEDKNIKEDGSLSNSSLHQEIVPTNYKDLNKSQQGNSGSKKGNICGFSGKKSHYAHGAVDAEEDYINSEYTSQEEEDEEYEEDGYGRCLQV